MTLFNPLYNALAAMGYTDPIHPPLTHMPIALVVAALIFGFSGWILRRPSLGKAGTLLSRAGLAVYFPHGVAGLHGLAAFLPGRLAAAHHY